MKAVGIICEYNPFHNGHLYHLNKVKEMFPDYTIILVMNGHFSQRGEATIMNKWDRTKIALTMGIDLVIELPFPFATQSADIFARGAIEILDTMQVEALVFGSESADISVLTDLAKVQLHHPAYQNSVKENMGLGMNYPTAMSKALLSVTGRETKTPNDLLGLSYVKALLELKSKIKPIAILRTSSYHDLAISSVSSASAIRNALEKGIFPKETMPEELQKYLKRPIFTKEYFPFMAYQIAANIVPLSTFQTVDEGIPSRIQKYIKDCETLEDLIQKIKTKRYTYNRISRMLIHILCGFTKEEAKMYPHIRYIRVLGFSTKGQKYLKIIKKELQLPLLTKWSDFKDPMLDLEWRATSVYASILSPKERRNLINQEYKTFSIKL